MEPQNNNGNFTVLSLTPQDQNDFDSTISTLPRDLTEFSNFPDMKEIDEWLKKVIEYNVEKGGKKTRGLLTVAAGKWFDQETGTGNPTSKLSRVVGWCVEMENYGVDDPEKTKEIVELFVELKLPKNYSIYQDQKYKSIKTQIEKLSEDLPQNLFLNLLEPIYKRQK